MSNDYRINPPPRKGRRLPPGPHRKLGKLSNGQAPNAQVKGAA